MCKQYYTARKPLDGTKDACDSLNLPTLHNNKSSKWVAVAVFLLEAEGEIIFIDSKLSTSWWNLLTLRFFFLSEL